MTAHVQSPQQVPSPQPTYNPRECVLKRVEASKKIELKVGAQLPDAVLFGLHNGAIQSYTLSKEFQNKRIALLTISGAFFEPIGRELQNIVKIHQHFSMQKIDRIVCIVPGSVTAVARWQKMIDPECKLMMLSDHHGDYIEKLGLGRSTWNWGGGVAPEQSHMIVDNMCIRYFQKDLNPKKLCYTTAVKIYGRCAEYEAMKFINGSSTQTQERQESKQAVPTPMSQTAGAIGAFMRKTEIQVGEKIPDVSLKREVIAQGKKKIQDFSFAQEVSSGKVLVFMFPCTFAKAYISCMEKYREHASSFSVEKIVCVVSDHLTNVNRWHADAQLKEKISFVADLGCELAVLTGLGCDASQRGLGFVLKPSCLLLEGGVVRRIVVAKDLEDLSALSPGSLGMEAVTSAFKRVSISTEQKVSAKKGKE